MNILSIESNRDEKYERARAELVAEAATKPIIHLHQFDCHLHQGDGDDVMHPDEDGDVLTEGDRCDLREMGQDVIRVQIPVGVSQADAARALRKVLAWVERDAKPFEMTAQHREIGFFLRTCCRDNADITLEDALKIAKEKAEVDLAEVF